MKYTVVVGNIGTVYAGESRQEANDTFAGYISEHRGRGHEERIVMLKGEEILHEDVVISTSDLYARSIHQAREGVRQLLGERGRPGLLQFVGLLAGGEEEDN